MKLIIQKSIFITSMKLTNLMMSILTTMLTPNLMWTRKNITIQYYFISVKNHKKIQILIKIAIISFTTYSLEQLNKYNS